MESFRLHPRLRFFERFAWASLIVVALGFGALGIYVTDVRLHVTSATRSLVAISDGWKLIRLGLVEEETRERKYVIERNRGGRAYHRAAVDSVTHIARGLERISDRADLPRIESLVADNATYGAAMQRLFDAVDARDTERIAALHRTADPAYDRMEDFARSAEERYGRDEYDALASLERTQARVTRTFPPLAFLALIALTASFLIVREYRRRSDAMVSAQLARLEIAAHDDALTGLGNHRAFRDSIAERSDNANALDVHLALVDIDHFKKVNDRYGHIRGDAVLRAIGTLLRQVPQTRAFRIGGDEFALLVRGLERPAMLAALERVRASAPTRLGGLTLSIGVASLARGDEDLAALRERADIALYEAKHRGRNTVVPFDPSLVAVSSSLYAKRVTLERVLARPEPYTIDFQPIYSLEGRIFGYEALARFDPDFASPTEAFEVAERLEQTVELDRRCIESVAARMPRGFAERIFLNVSPTTLANESAAVACFERFAADTAIPRENVTIEVAERTRISLAALRTIERLRSIGFLIALVDTGGGNANIALLASLPCDVIKFDGSLLAEREPGEREERATALIVGLFAIAKGLACTLVFEGIESQSQIARCFDLAIRNDALARVGLQGDALRRPGALPASDPEPHPAIAGSPLQPVAS